MKNLDTLRLKRTVENFRDKRVLVLGDVMLDRYIWGDVSRISPEAPIPVVEVKRDTSCLGGAGNVSHNLERLGAFPLLAGIVGNDPEGEWIRQNVSDSRGIFAIPGRPTTVKTRIIAHHQQVVRVDLEKKQPVSPEVENQILEFIQSSNCDGIIISDYNKGMLVESLVKRTLSFASERKIPVFVDPKIENFDLFSPVTLIAPNHHEAEKIVHHECSSDTQIEKAGQKILSLISAQYLILKRGELGISTSLLSPRKFMMSQAQEIQSSRQPHSPSFPAPQSRKLPSLPTQPQGSLWARSAQPLSPLTNSSKRL